MTESKAPNGGLVGDGNFVRARRETLPRVATGGKVEERPISWPGIHPPLNSQRVNRAS